jgi:hypothetical protein
VTDNNDRGDHDDEIFVYNIDQEQNNGAFADVMIQPGHYVKFKLDTGAGANVIPKKVYDAIPEKPKMTKVTDVRLTSYTGQSLKMLGRIQLQCEYKGKKATHAFYIVDTAAPPIASLQLCLDLHLIKLVYTVDNKPQYSKTPYMTRESVLQNDKDLFEGQGTFEAESVIRIDEKATPVVHPPRRFPSAIHDRLKQELISMEKAGIIAKVTVPTEWVNSLVVVEKPNGKLRICLDPRDLNNAIKRPYYCAPVLDDVLPKLAGSQYFSKLDARSGYWTIKLEEKSTYFTTFNSPFGRYRFLRMPFGINSAQDEFQRMIDEAFEGLPGVFALVDDVLICGKTREEHDANLRAALDRCREKNIRLNADKLTVGATEVNYFGHVISAEGLKPDPAKIKAIQEMPTPKNKKELESLLGMVTYMAKFAPSLSDVTKPLRDLLKKEVEFQWDAQHDAALKKTKETLVSQPVLTFFDPKKQITLQVDASKHGVGATILQDGKPVAYASKALTPTQQGYARLKRSCMPWCLDVTDSITTSTDMTYWFSQTTSLLKQSSKNRCMQHQPDYNA